MNIFKIIILSLALISLPASQSFAHDHCTVGPIEHLKNGSFKLNKKEGFSTEEMKLTDTIDLKLIDDSCEYSGQIYVFTIKEPRPKDHILGAEYKKAIEMLSLLEEKLPPEPRYDQAKKAITAYTNVMRNPELKTELVIERYDFDYHSYILVDADLYSYPATVEITLVKGPE